MTSHRYLVRWKPYHILKVLHGDEKCVVPKGCDIISSPLEMVEEYIEKWQGNIDWDLVLELHRDKNYFEIFKMHNINKWTDDHYCCDSRHIKHVEYNVAIYKNSTGRVG